MNTTASSRQRIAVFGAGAIGTAFAFELARAGHDVTVVARGARLAQLRGDGGIVTHDGRRADVAVVDSFDVEAAFFGAAFFFGAALFGAAFFFDVVAFFFVAISPSVCRTVSAWGA